MVKLYRKETLPRTKEVPLKFKIKQVEKKMNTDLSELERSLPPLPPASSRIYAGSENLIDLDQGVSPLLVNERAASMALMSSQSSPVPPQVERQIW